MSSRHELHMTIGAAPTGAASFEHDLRMVKAALLYADRVTLCSPTSSLLLQTLALGTLTREQQLLVCEEIIRASPGGRLSRAHNILHNYKVMAKKTKLRPDEVRQMAKLERMLEGVWDDVCATLEKLADESGAAGIVGALQSGLVELHPFDVSPGASDIAKQFVDVIGGAITNGLTYPLFDDTTGNLLSSFIREGKLDVSKSAAIRGREGGLVGNLLERLPLFDEASVEEILDVRKELERPLARFRSVVIGFAAGIETAAWDDDFTSDAERVYRKEVEPAILDIEDAVKSNILLGRLWPKSINEGLSLLGTSAIGMLISQIDALPEIARSFLIPGLPAVDVIQRTIHDWREKQREIERMQLYFYYKAGKLLKRKVA